MVKIDKKIDDNFFEMGLYEKIRGFIKKYSKQMCAFAVILLLLTSFFVTYRIFSDKKIWSMQRDFLLLDSIDSKLSFVKKYGAAPLCGIVLLELGDGEFGKSNFKLASTYYDLSVKAFARNELSNRAKIYYAISMLKLGDGEASFTALDKIVHDSAVGMHFRVDALEKYICCAREVGNGKKVDELLSYAACLPMSEAWKNRIKFEAK